MSMIFLLENIQAIKKAKIYWNDGEIVEFIGDNSNGKSTLSKTLDYIVKGDIFDKHIRKDIINDEADRAQIWMQSDTKKLGIILYRHGTDSCFMWGNAGDEKLNSRRATEGGFKEVLFWFGFRFYQKGEVCLQVFPTYGPIPFVTTSGSTNQEIYDDLSSDKIADNFISFFEEYTSPLIRSKEKEFKESEGRIRSILENIQEWNYESYEEMGNKLKEMIEVMDNISMFKFDNIPIPPTFIANENPTYEFKKIPVFGNYKGEDIPVFEFKKVPVIKEPRDIPKTFRFDSIKVPIVELKEFKYTTMMEKHLSDMIIILNKKCPMCGSNLIGEIHNHEVEV